MPHTIPLLLAFLLLSCSPQPSGQSAQKGVLDIRQGVQDLVSLRGEWKFYPNFLGTPSAEQPYRYEQIPSLWNGKEPFPSGQGAGTYVLEILLPEDPTIYGIYQPEVRSNFRLTVGNRTLNSGFPSLEKSQSIPSAEGKNFTISASNRLHIQLEVSNFQHREGGIPYPPYFGSAATIQNYILSQGTVDLAIMGAIFMFGLYHFILFFYRGKQRESFYFGFFCFIFATRIPFTGIKSIYLPFPNIAWELVVYMEFVSVFISVVLFLWFLESLLSGFLSLKYLRWITAFVMFCSAYGLVIEPYYYTQVEPIFQVLGVLLGLSIAIRLVFLSLQKNPDSFLVLIGYLLLLFGFLSDIFSAVSNFNNISISQFSVFLFLGFQSTLVTLRTSRDLKRKNLVKEEFESKNETFILTNRFYGKFIPVDFLNHLGKTSIETIQLGDSTQREMTVLFADIWEYWNILYSIPLENRILFTNSYLGRIGPQIRKHNGFIDKYIGSAVMALFDGGIQDALRAAQAIQWELESYNERRKSFGYIPLHAGIGIHSGDTMLGILGEEERLESTVISDTVNLASRIQGLTKKYNARILVTLTALMLHEELDSIPYRILDFVRVKGKQETVMIAEVLIPNIDLVSDLKIQTKEVFEAAIFDYERADFEGALKGFLEVISLNPDDLASKIYVERCEYYKIAGVSELWDGVAEWEK